MSEFFFSNLFVIQNVGTIFRSSESFKIHSKEKFIIYVKGNNQSHLNFVSRFLRHHHINDFVLLQSYKGKLEIYENQPLNEDCQPSLAKISSRDNLFALQRSNLFFCPIKVLFLLKKVKNKHKVCRIPDFDRDVVNEIAKRMNFTVISQNVPESLQNMTPVEFVVNALRHNKVDMGAGGLLFKKDRLELSQCYPHYSAHYLTYIRSQKQFLKFFSIITSPMKMTVWATVLSLHLFSTLLLSLSKDNNGVMEITSLTFGVSLPNLSKKLSQRLILVSWMICSLLFTTLYHAKFFEHILLDIRKPLPKTFNDLIRENYTLLLHPINYLNVKNVPEVKKMHKIVTNDFPLESVEHITDSFEKVASVNPAQILFSRIDLLEELHFLTQEFVPLYFSLIQTKNSFLTKKIENILGNLKDFGIIGKMAESNFCRPFSGRLGKNRKREKAGFKELKEIFKVVGALQVVSVAIFFCEIFWFEKVLGFNKNSG